MSTCPKCGEPFGAAFVAKAAAESRIIFEVTPAPGEYFDVATIGGLLVDLSKLLRATSKELGTKAITLLERVDCKEGGAMAFHCIIARGPNVSRKRGTDPGICLGGEK